MMIRILNLVWYPLLFLSFEGAAQVKNGDVTPLLSIHSPEDTLKDSTGRWTKVWRGQILHTIFLNKDNSLVGCRKGESDTLMLWSVQEGQAEQLAILGGIGRVDLVAISQDEERLAAVVYNRADEKYILCCYLIRERNWVWKVDLPDDYYFAIWFIRNEAEIIAVGRGSLYSIDAENGKILSQRKSVVGDYELNSIRMMYLNISPSGRYFLIWNRKEDRGESLFSWFSAKANETVTIWDVVSDKLVTAFDKPGGELNAAAFTSDEEHVVLSSSDNRIRLWSIRESKIERESDCPTGYYIMTSERFVLLGNVVGKGVIVLKYPELVPLWRIDEVEYGGYPPQVPEITLDRQGKHLAFQRGCRFYLYDTTKWKELWSISLCVPK